MINLNSFELISFFLILILKGLLHLNNNKKAKLNSKRFKIIQKVLDNNNHQNNKKKIIIVIIIISQQYKI